VVQLDRRRGLVIDEEAVTAKFGVAPSSITDYLALVGDSADGFPGLAGWGSKSAAAVLSRYGRLEDVPDSAADWKVAVRGSGTLAATLASERELAYLFRDLATLRIDPPVLASVDELRWTGARAGFEQLARDVLDSPSLFERVRRMEGRLAGE
jgi:5'-3' exonuclease